MLKKRINSAASWFVNVCCFASNIILLYASVGTILAILLRPEEIDVLWTFGFFTLAGVGIILFGALLMAMCSFVDYEEEPDYYFRYNVLAIYLYFLPLTLVRWARKFVSPRIALA